MKRAMLFKLEWSDWNVMKYRLLIAAILAAASWQAMAQDTLPQDAPAPEKRFDTRYTFALIDDATFDSNFIPPLP